MTATPLGANEGNCLLASVFYVGGLSGFSGSIVFYDS